MFSDVCSSFTAAKTAIFATEHEHFPLKLFHAEGYLRRTVDGHLSGQK